MKFTVEELGILINSLEDSIQGMFEMDYGSPTKTFENDIRASKNLVNSFKKELDERGYVMYVGQPEKKEIVVERERKYQEKMRKKNG